MMTKEQRILEIREIAKLVNQIAVLSHYQVVKVHGIQVMLATLANISEQIEFVQGASDRQSHI